MSRLQQLKRRAESRVAATETYPTKGTALPDAIRRSVHDLCTRAGAARTFSGALDIQISALRLADWLMDTLQEWVPTSTATTESVVKACVDLVNVMRSCPLMSPAQLQADPDAYGREPLFGEAETESLRTFRRARGVWCKDLRASSGTLCHELNALMTNPKSRRKKTVTVDTGHEVMLEGFQVILKYYDAPPEELSRAGLDRVKAMLREYKKRLSLRAPALLDKTLPLVLDFSVGGDEGLTASWHMDHVRLMPLIGSFDGMTPVDQAAIFAHEMGHHIFNTVLSTEAKNAWSSERIRQRLPKSLNRLNERVQNAVDAGVPLHEYDPEAYVQCETLYSGVSGGHGFDAANRHPTLMRRYVDMGGTVIVPTQPITSYAETNSEEAFCEAFGRYIIYGPQVLTEWTRAKLDEVLPELRVVQGRKVAVAPGEAAYVPLIIAKHTFRSAYGDLIPGGRHYEWVSADFRKGEKHRLLCPADGTEVYVSDADLEEHFNVSRVKKNLRGPPDSSAFDQMLKHVRKAPARHPRELTRPTDVDMKAMGWDDEGWTLTDTTVGGRYGRAAREHAGAGRVATVHAELCGADADASGPQTRADVRGTSRRAICASVRRAGEAAVALLVRAHEQRIGGHRSRASRSGDRGSLVRVSSLDLDTNTDTNSLDGPHGSGVGSDHVQSIRDEGRGSERERRGSGGRMPLHRLGSGRRERGAPHQEECVRARGYGGGGRGEVGLIPRVRRHLGHGDLRRVAAASDFKGITFADFRRALEDGGYSPRGQNGSHQIWVKPGAPFVTFDTRGGHGVIRPDEVDKMVRQSGLYGADLLQWLGRPIPQRLLDERARGMEAAAKAKEDAAEVARAARDAERVKQVEERLILAEPVLRATTEDDILAVDDMPGFALTTALPKGVAVEERPDGTTVIAEWFFTQDYDQRKKALWQAWLGRTAKYIPQSPQSWERKTNVDVADLRADLKVPDGYRQELLAKLRRAQEAAQGRNRPSVPAGKPGLWQRLKGLVPSGHVPRYAAAQLPEVEGQAGWAWFDNQSGGSPIYDDANYNPPYGLDSIIKHMQDVETLAEAQWAHGFHPRPAPPFPQPFWRRLGPSAFRTARFWDVDANFSNGAWAEYTIGIVDTTDDANEVDAYDADIAKALGIPGVAPAAPAKWSCGHKKQTGDNYCKVCSVFGRNVTSRRGAITVTAGDLVIGPWAIDAPSRRHVPKPSRSSVTPWLELRRPRMVIDESYRGYAVVEAVHDGVLCTFYIFVRQWGKSAQGLFMFDIDWIVSRERDRAPGDDVPKTLGEEGPFNTAAEAFQQACGRLGLRASGRMLELVR